MTLVNEPEPDPYVRVEGPPQSTPDFDVVNGMRLRASSDGVYALHRASGKTTQVEVTGMPEPLRLTGPWDVRFQSNRGAPEKARFERLTSWTEHTDPGVRHFSGTATNTIHFDVPEGFCKPDDEVWLDLGDVREIAELRLNDQNLGVLWRRPFRVEVSNALRAGKNTLEIDVTNLWVNRLIGDEQYPDDCEWNESYLVRWPEWLINGKPRPATDRVTFTTWKHWNAEDTLLPSGLIGPVTLSGVKLVPVP